MAQVYRDRIVGWVRGILPETVVKGVEEQLSGTCTTEIAAFHEFTALLVDSTLTKNYDHIIFDTAPTGHTIRLLQLPGAWSDFLEEDQGDISCLSHLAGLEKQWEQYKAAVDALADSSRTRLILVVRASRRRCAKLLVHMKNLLLLACSGSTWLSTAFCPASKQKMTGWQPPFASVNKLRSLQCLMC